MSLVKCIVKQKYVENNELKIRLINTAGFKLEEASVDRYWGTGIPVYSRKFRKARYPGKNIMGSILEEILMTSFRMVFVIEEYPQDPRRLIGLMIIMEKLCHLSSPASLMMSMKIKTKQE